MKLTLDTIARCTSGYTKKKRDESVEHYLKRLTHLYLEDRGIDEIGDDLALCRNLTVLYLYDNKLPKVPNLTYNHNITHLYLQNNQICRVENLTPLRKLTKLYLGGNCITVVEGLDKLDALQELHIEHQDLPPGEKILFDPRSLVNLSKTLQVLNVSGNNLDSITDLLCLRDLTQFSASDNHLTDMKELSHLLSAWRYLWRLDLQGNPLCHKSKYRDRLIVMATNLEVLDGKEITETSRQFIKNWQASKDERKRKNELALLHKNTDLGSLGEKDLPPVSIQRHASIPGYIMPGLPRKQFEAVLARSNTLTSSAPPGLRGDKKVSAPRLKNTYGTTVQPRPNTGHLHKKMSSVTMGTDFSAGDSMSVQPVHLPINM